MENLLNKWFLENENCTYKEFCEIYNNGNPDLSEITFINIPDNLRFSTIQIVIHPWFEEFLDKLGIKTEWYQKCLSTKYGRDLLAYMKNGLANNPNFLNSPSCYLTYYQQFITPSKEERNKWIEYQKLWDEFRKRKVSEGSAIINTSV